MEINIANNNPQTPLDGDSDDWASIGEIIEESGGIDRILQATDNTWGPWKLSKDGFLFVEEPCLYEIPTEGLRAVESSTKWIWHLAEKNWVTAEVMGYFVLAVLSLGGLCPKPDEETNKREAGDSLAIAA